MSKQNEIQRNIINTVLPEFEQVRIWAKKKGIYDSGDLKTQSLKLFEEAGELAQAVLKNDECELIDAIGDCIVVLINVAELAEKKFSKKCESICDCEDNKKTCMIISAENCLQAAYDTIKSRTGKMEDGNFVKQKELVLPNEIKSFVDVNKFVINLYENNSLFHFDDDANDILEDGFFKFNEKEADKINTLVNQCFNVCKKINIDIHEIIQNVNKNEKI
jgi:NTP pyrophosphatase (non-canonical NTP hydrolase)